MTGTTSVGSRRPSLNEHLRLGGAPDTLRHLILEIARAAKYIQYALRTTEAGLAGSMNQFGEEQIKLDVLSNDIIERHLRESQLVSSYISEEQADVVELDARAPYAVVFDPLDGSSLVDANFSIGSIVGVYAAGDLIGRKPREQIAALYTLYGPRTLLVYSVGNGVHEFILNDVGEFIALREHIGIGDEARNFSPGNLRAVTDTPAYAAVMQDWMSRALTLRYSGCMVTDIHHIFSKGQGVFTNIGGNTYPEGKLRLAFECGPFAYLAENAGGSASNGRIPILDITIDKVDQRTPIIIGSKNEVEHVVQLLK